MPDLRNMTREEIHEGVEFVNEFLRKEFPDPGG